MFGSSHLGHADHYGRSAYFQERYGAKVGTLDVLAAREPGDRNPFTVGTAEYQKFVGVMAGCARSISRGEESVDDSA